MNAVARYLKALDRPDRHKEVASADQVYGREALKKLFDTSDPVAVNLGADEAMPAQEALRKQGMMTSEA
jgi:hypothetical protein